jgi:membrane protein YqaA with SNARE-associated domain
MEGPRLLKKEAEYSVGFRTDGGPEGIPIIPDMEAWMQSLLAWLMSTLALPEIGLSTLFVVSFISATLLPLGSEPAVFGLVKLNPELFWPAVLVATVGNTLGGMVSWWMGLGASEAWHRLQAKREAHAGGAPAAPSNPAASHRKAARWLERYGPKACLLAWLPVVGDPLCSVAGWLKLPFWPCVVYMAIGKFGRYVTMTAALLWFFPGLASP